MKYLLLFCELFLYALSIKRIKHYSKNKSSIFCKPDWLNRPDEEVIIVQPPEYFQNKDISLFDALYNSDSQMDSSSHSFSQLSIREISESYQFSLAFLGDFMVQLGCKTPLDIDNKIANLLIGEKIFDLLNAVTTLDPYEANSGYDSFSLNELAETFNVSKEKILKISIKEDLNLPFGLDTVLHSSLVDKIRNNILYDEYEEDNVIDATDAEYIEMKKDKNISDINDENF